MQFPVRAMTVAAAGLAMPTAWAHARSFDYLSQNRKVFVEARPADALGESDFRFAPAYDPFMESIAASWQISEPASLASSEAQQSSTLGAEHISAAGFAFALAGTEAVFAQSFSAFETTFALLEPTAVAVNAIVGGTAFFQLQGPTTDILLIDDELIITLMLEPGEYLCRADATCAPAGGGEQVGSFHLALAIVPAPAGLPIAIAALLGAAPRRRAGTLA